MKNLFKLVIREVKIHMSSLTNLWSFISLFFLGILIFVFAVGSKTNYLSQLYLPIVWVIFLFSLILGAEAFLLEDHTDGSLKELQFLGYSKEIIILAKSISMWIIYIIPSIFIMSTPFAKVISTPYFVAFLTYFRIRRTLAYWPC